MGACDICGKSDTWTEPLKQDYQTDSIKKACSDCLREANKHLAKLQKMTYQLNTTWMQRFMTAMRERTSL